MSALASDYPVLNARHEKAWVSFSLEVEMLAQALAIVLSFILMSRDTEDHHFVHEVF